MHNYTIPSGTRSISPGSSSASIPTTLVAIGAISTARRPLLAYGAVVLDEIIRRSKPKEIVISVAGVREGLLYERLDKTTRREDALIAAAREFNVLRSRAPRARRRALCLGRLLSCARSASMTKARKRSGYAMPPVSWPISAGARHPDYRGEQSLNMIANAGFVGVDHPGRAFIALCSRVPLRWPGGDQIGPELRRLVSARLLDRARILGAAMRVAYIISAGMPGILPRTPMLCARGVVDLTLPPELADLASERLQNRLQRLARLIGRDAAIRTDQ